LDCDEFKFLRAKFSSGVCLRELRSIAVVLSQLTGLLEPNRDIKRSYVLLIKWFKDHWNQILPWLPLIQLRDGEDRPIDGRREISERSRRGRSQVHHAETQTLTDSGISELGEFCVVHQTSESVLY
jgi:hypothetical protein